MSLEYWISLSVILFRLVAPLTLFRWRLLGAFISIFADAIDVFVFQKFGWGFGNNGRYHNMDKVLDIYYLFLELCVSRAWVDALAKKTAKVLFYWRLFGVVLFEATGARFLMLLAPNIFENFYIFWAVCERYFKNFKLTYKKLAIIILVVGLPKIGQEYVMHFKYPDRTWAFIRDTFFFWLY